MIWLVDADVVNEHLLWEGGGLVGIAGPISSCCQIQNDEEGMIEDPAGAGRKVSGSAVSDEVTVDEEFYVVGGPLYGVEMKVSVNGLACGKGELCGDVMRAAVSGTMEG